MKNNKPKPTNRDFKTAITNLIQEHARLVQYVRSVDAAFTEFVRFNKQEYNFTKYIEERRKANDKSNQQDTGESSGGDREAKVRNIKTKTGGKAKSKASSPDMKA